MHIISQTAKSFDASMYEMTLSPSFWYLSVNSILVTQQIGYDILSTNSKKEGDANENSIL